MCVSSIMVIGFSTFGLMVAFRCFLRLSLPLDGGMAKGFDYVLLSFGGGKASALASIGHFFWRFYQ